MNFESSSLSFSKLSLLLFSCPRNAVCYVLPQMGEHAEIPVQRLRQRRNAVIQKLKPFHLLPLEIQDLDGMRFRCPALGFLDSSVMYVFKFLTMANDDIIVLKNFLINLNVSPS